MQGKKVYQEQLFTQFRLSERVPKDIFYRKLKEVLELKFTQKLAKSKAKSLAFVFLQIDLLINEMLTVLSPPKNNKIQRRFI